MRLASTMSKKNRLPCITVVIPTFNRGWIIEEAIKSVLAQDFLDFELIIVDDGSTDNTSAILSRYVNDIIVLNQKNKGVSAARNKGIMEGSGEYVAFLDSDDLWLPEKLSRQVDFFLKNPEAMICQTNEIWIRNGVRVNPKKVHKKPSGMIFMPSLLRCLVSPSAVMMRRKLFENIGLFDEQMPACEDYDLWLRVSHCYPVYLIDIPLVVKRGGHPDQLSKAPGLDRFRIDALVKMLENSNLTAVQRCATVDILQKKCQIYAAGCLKRGRTDEHAHYEDMSSRYFLQR